MPQKMRGAAELLSLLYADLDAITDEARDAHREAKRNPEYVRDRCDQILELVEQMERRIRDDLEPKLERQAPEYEKRLRALEQKVEALETTGRIVQFRREA